MKKLTGMIIMAALFLSTCIPAYARPQYSEETKRLMREAGLRTEELEWEEIDRRQQMAFTSTVTDMPAGAGTAAQRTAMTSSIPCRKTPRQMTDTDPAGSMNCISMKITDRMSGIRSTEAIVSTASTSSDIRTKCKEAQRVYLVYPHLLPAICR